MKLLIILQIVVSLLLGPPSVYVKGKGYSGYIFKKEYFVMGSIENQQSRFTPTFEEVERAEKLVKARLPELNKHKINQYGTCPNIEKKLKKYIRQYVGLMNKTGEKVIWINMLMHPSSDYASEDIIYVYDGCSNNWKVKVNITTGEVYDLDVNGQG
jgi:hypothetical protein